MTEHGRLPVCTRPSGTENHCFHAHFLLFPASPDITELSRPHFDQAQEASSLEEALAIARDQQEYFLLSAVPNRFFVMSHHHDLMRQFARHIVAEAVGCTERADWSAFPDRAKSETAARDFAHIVPASIRTPWIQQK
jgi:hypothetical protein